MADLTVIVCMAFDHRSPTDGLRQFKECIYKSPFVESAMEVFGTFDLIVQARVRSLAEYTEQMDRIAHKLRLFVARVETNFVGKKIEAQVSMGDALWLPVEGGHKQVPANLIDKIEAHGDYMKVYVGDWHCMVHTTIRQMCEKLSPEHFIQLHRSIVVRAEFIERLVHQNRRWIARLRDGTHQRIAKSRVADIVRLISPDRSIAGGTSPKKGKADERPEPENEIKLRVVT